MSSSVQRVADALAQAGVQTEVIEQKVTARTAAEAAAAVGVEVDQIAKSIILESKDGTELCLFITAGSNRVDLEKAAGLAGMPLRQAKANTIRDRTGFAIGGVAPIGHLTPIRAWMDQRLTEFNTVWAAGGSPFHVFEIDPAQMADLAQATVADFVD